MLAKLLIVALASLQLSSAFDYDITGGDISLADVETGIGSLKTIFTNDEIAVSVDRIQWEANDSNETTDGAIFYFTFVDGALANEGNVTLDGVGRELPSSIDAGTVKVSSSGRHTIEVKLIVGESEAIADMEVEAYRAGVAIIPLVIILILALWTHMVRDLSNRRQRNVQYPPSHLIFMIAFHRSKFPCSQAFWLVLALFKAISSLVSRSRLRITS